MKALANQYAYLSPEERFCLILAAGARGDEDERDRLSRASKRILLSVPDYQPYSMAFQELAELTLMDLVEEAARYLDLLGRPDDGDDSADDEEDDTASEPEADADVESVEDDIEAGDYEPSTWERNLRLAYAAGFVLKRKTAGWRVFCERLTVPPFCLFEMLPGFDRLQRALEVAENAAFAPEGFMRWLNDIRPNGTPEILEMPMSVEAIADATAYMFRERVKWWGGE